jgi:hypothetical protein
MITDDAQDLQDQVRERPYSSFLVKCWGLSGGAWRIKVQHIQSGEWTPVTTLVDAAGWIQGRCGGQEAAAESHRREEDGRDDLTRYPI